MDAGAADQVRTAQVVLPCADLDATLGFFVDRLGFRIDAIHPADSPVVAVISGYGVRLRLQRGGEGAPGVLRLLCRDPLAAGGGATELSAPNGTWIELVEADPPLVVPPIKTSFVLSTNARAIWRDGRAGMRYRDLIPNRQGGSVVASHIRIDAGSDLADYVHYHEVRFQVIYCHKGWVRVVYEDQGPPFVLQPGDCVLQPPRIRHRVLESSAGLEVIEITCPAEHETLADHDLPLPTSAVRPLREFAGQRFVRHEAAAATWQPWRLEGFECQDTGIAAATGGFASVRAVHVIRMPARGSYPQHEWYRHDAEFLFLFVREGALTLRLPAHASRRLTAGDAAVLPATLRYAFTECSTDAALLEVALPASFQTLRGPDAD